MDIPQYKKEVKEIDMKSRIYVCHTYYHALIAIVKELVVYKDSKGEATLILSKMSNDFGTLDERVRQSGLFEEVLMYDEKPDTAFKGLEKYRKDTGNIVTNMWSRIIFTKKFGKLLEADIPVDFKQYKDIYVFCDSDPIGFYLSYKKICYHAVEDGLDTLRLSDQARITNKGHFEIKAWMAAHNLIFIENGYSKYCLDMEVNDISVCPHPLPNFVEVSRNDLFDKLTEEDKRLLITLFIEKLPELEEQIHNAPSDLPKYLILTEPLCELDVRERLFRDVIDEYCQGAVAVIKPHPRDVLDYKKLFPEVIVIEGKFPMEILNYIPGMTFDKVISVLTVPGSIKFSGDVVFLGLDFMDKYEDPEIHRGNELI